MVSHQKHLIIFISLGVLSGVLFFLQNQSEPTYTDTLTQFSEEIPPPRTNDHYKWRSISDITVVNYFSLDCPHCRELFLKEDVLKEKYKNQFSLVYRHSPLPSIQPLSFKKAVLAECLGVTGGDEKFFGYVGSVFSEYVPGHADNEWARALTEPFIVDTSEYDVCLKGEGIKQVNDSVEEALVHRVYGTPTIAVFRGETLIVRLDLENARTILRLYDSLGNITPP